MLNFSEGCCQRPFYARLQLRLPFSPKEVRAWQTCRIKVNTRTLCRALRGKNVEARRRHVIVAGRCCSHCEQYWGSQGQSQGGTKGPLRRFHMRGLAEPSRNQVCLQRVLGKFEFRGLAEPSRNQVFLQRVLGETVRNQVEPRWNQMSPAEIPYAKLKIGVLGAWRNQVGTKVEPSVFADVPSRFAFWAPAPSFN